MPTPNAYNGNGPSLNSVNAAGLQYGGDPRQAMINAILNMGGNPFNSNPLMKMLLATAPGLQAASYLSNIGAKPDDINAMGGTGQMFGDFLKGQLSGGNIFQTLSNASRNLPQYMNQLRDYQGNVQSGGIPNGQISPFAAELENQLQSPQGMGGLMTALNAPGLGSLAGSYQGGLMSNLGAQHNRMLNEYGQGTDPLKVPNFFDYVFGRG